MKKIRIKGGNILKGEVAISGAKNAALPVLAATLLTDEEIIINNLPNLSDTLAMQKLLEDLGAKCSIVGESSVEDGSAKRAIKINCADVKRAVAPYDIVKTMRASVLVLGPLLARFGSASVSLPGGCAIGARPVDLHIEALCSLGAEIHVENGNIVATANGRLKGGNYRFPQISVGATENAICAAALADGKSVFENCAKEPEIECLADFLNAMGAKISGAGTSTIIIEGVEKLRGTDFALIPDRIEAATYAIAAAATKGKVVLKNVNYEHCKAVLEVLTKIGVHIEKQDEQILVDAAKHKINSTKINTEPYPGFPTDVQAQMMTLLCLANGESEVAENIFENRFMHVQELARMGAQIKVNGKKCIVQGSGDFQAATVMASDLRASVSLVIAGLCARGETVIDRVYHLFRGYEMVCEKLSALGADIEVMDDVVRAF